MFNAMFHAIDLICYGFTLYFLVVVLNETRNDMKGKIYSDKKQYLRKFAKQFWDNLIFRLP